MKLTVPRNHLERLSVPAPDDALDMVRSNVRALGRTALRVLGEPADAFRARVRRALLRVARQFDANAETRDPAAPVIMTGHQSELFHPGVWIKNHFIAWLAREAGGWGANLVLDTDVPSQLGVDVPTFEGERLTRRTVPLAPHAWGTPFENISITQDEVRDWSEEVSRLVAGDGTRAAFQRFAKLFVSESRRDKRFAFALARARAAEEHTHSVHNAEVIASLLCAEEVFLRFFLWIVDAEEAFRDVYNSALDDYRKLFRERSPTLPAPNLVRSGDAFEVPFWLEDHSRRRAFVRRDGGGWVLGDGKEETARFRSVAELKRLAEGGLKIRSRAIMTTFFLRLFGCDLFVHGVGGARYDWVTDEVMRRFAGVEPPGFVTLSATAHLPLPVRHGSVQERRRLDALLRDMRYNPQRHIEDSDRSHAEVARLIARKRELIGRRSPTAHGRYADFLEIKGVNRLLYERLGRQRQGVQALREATVRDIRHNAVARARDYAYVFYQDEVLKALYRFP